MEHDDGRFMKMALMLAAKAGPYPNPRVGAVLVKRGKVIGTGYHKAAGKPHAEILAIEDAKGKTRNPHAALGATLYVTLEPCSHTNKRTGPCTDAIIKEGIGRVVFAMKDPNPLVSGAAVLRENGVNVGGPTREPAARAMNRRYLANISRKPFVAIKMAMSSDGKTATRTGDSRWISCERSRKLVHRMRSESDAVMVGAGTIMADDPELTAHDAGPDPWRVIVDGRLRIPLHARVVKNPDHKTMVATASGAPKTRIARLKRMGVQAFACGDGHVDMKKLILGLSAMGIKKILIEGGSELNAAAIEAGIVDKLYLFIAPRIIGGVDGKPVIGGKGIARMRQALKLKDMKARKIGSDFLLEADIIR